MQVYPLIGSIEDINIFMICVVEPRGKKSGKTVRNTGKVREFLDSKKREPCELLHKVTVTVTVPIKV